MSGARTGLLHHAGSERSRQSKAQIPTGAALHLPPSLPSSQFDPLIHPDTTSLQRMHTPIPVPSSIRAHLKNRKPLLPSIPPSLPVTQQTQLRCPWVYVLEMCLSGYGGGNAPPNFTSLLCLPVTEGSGHRAHLEVKVIQPRVVHDCLELAGAGNEVQDHDGQRDEVVVHEEILLCDARLFLGPDDDDTLM